MSREILAALSPWSGVDVEGTAGLSPRLEDLDGKTIGMFSDFMVVSMCMLHAVETELHRRFPNARFSYIQYAKDPTRIVDDPEFQPAFLEWLNGVDCVLAFYGAVPSSSLFLGYNCAYMEKLGKPTAMLVVPRTYSAGIRGVRAMGVPGLRTIQYDVTVDKITGHVNDEMTAAAMAPDMDRLVEELVHALTRPLTEEEAHPTPPDQSYANDLVTGTAKEISRIFYKRGWTNGQPIEIPTREAVDEMLRGTDLPADHIVAYLPPKMGAATVEKIAVNAVMAGCLPTYLPILIAAVKGCLDHRISLEGWTCSQSTWGPMLTLSGPIVKDINLNTGTNALSPYYKPNVAIPRAFGYIMMNIAGLRPGLEDLSEAGHENRLGFCVGDDLGNNPWGPVHTELGLDDPEASAVTLFWPQEHRAMTTTNPTDALSWLCTINPYGWDPGMAMVFTPLCAKMMAEAGWTKERIKRYIVEYARRPASEVDLQWLKGNNHPPHTVELPESPSHSTRVFWSDRHMFLLVAGGHAGPMITVYGGGGDHGGPSCTAIDLPTHWDELVREYSAVKPEYIDY